MASGILALLPNACECWFTERVLQMEHLLLEVATANMVTVATAGMSGSCQVHISVIVSVSTASFNCAYGPSSAYSAPLPSRLGEKSASRDYERTWAKTSELLPKELTLPSRLRPRVTAAAVHLEQCETDPMLYKSWKYR